MADQRINDKLKEDDLVARLRARDSSAMSQLYDMYSPTLYGVVLQIVKVEEVAEDVLQEAFVKIWNSFDKYDASKGRLFTWMINICRNLAIDTIRSKQYRVSNQSENIEADSRTYYYTDTFKPEHIGVRDMVDNLNPEQKQVIDLMYFKGLTQSEIAESYNIPLGTVKTRVRSAVKHLTRIFKGRA
ncbi:sigma-70 family RNA polymerase sigma factor [uncultured Pontibacter sp.]|uniref:RNA polymerase sigma factor n=1 Tax=uncultured Pontibacter sp. TaxID=453356 RepID=UPI00261C2A68|nr:sigma-70 family RNA polymerase sigma factor [uncultured Pontibacter sp.]